MDKKLTVQEGIELKKRINEIKSKFHSQELLEKEIEKIRKQIISERIQTPKLETPKRQEKIIELVSRIPTLPTNTLVPFPNFLAKTSVFSPLKRNLNPEKKNTNGDWVQLQTPPHYTLLYNGPYLTMEEQNLYTLLIKKAEGSSSDESIYISRYNILKELGYVTVSSHQYKWLYQAMNHLIQANIKIILETNIIKNIFEEESDNKINEITMHLIDEFSYNGEVYSFKINKNSLFLYSSNNYAWNNLETKKEILDKSSKGTNMWIYSFILSESKGEHSYKIDTIYKYINSSKKMADFRKDLEYAFNLMLELKVINRFYLHENQYITWER